MTVSGNMNVQLEGGSPWGFRLQGGGGFPLQVIKIRKRSKSFKHLVEGDIIIKVNGVSAQGKSHEAVMDMVDATVGPVLHLEIHRGEALHKIPKTAPAPAPRSAVAPASQASSRSSSVHSSEQSMHQHSMEESMRQKMISSQQMSSQQSSQQSVHQQQQVTKSNIVLQNQQQQQQQRVTQRQLSGQWQESSSQNQQQVSQQQMSSQQQQYSLQHQQSMADQQRLAQLQLAEQEMARQQLAHQRQSVQTQIQHQQHQQQQQQQQLQQQQLLEQQQLQQQQLQQQQLQQQQLQQQIQQLQQQQAMSEQQSMQSVQQTESQYEEQTTSVSHAMWNSSQSIHEVQSDLVQQAYTSAPKPFKPKIAGHLPLRDFTPVKPSPPTTPARMTPVPPAYDKENVAPSPIPKAPTPVNVPQFNVKNYKNIVNQEWREAELQELDLPVPDYTKKMTIPPRPVEHEPTPPMPKKEITIPDMTLKPAPPVAPKPKRVFAEVQLPVEAEPWIPDDEIIPIKPEDRPHLPIFGPPVVYGLNPALAPNAGEDESMISETSSGSRKKKIYSDSSFYYDPKGVYPTIEDQIDLCKKISNSLTAAANSRARGATMFAKRQKRSSKWIHAGFSEGMVADLEELASELDEIDGGNKPLFQFRIPKVAGQEAQTVTSYFDQMVSVDSPPTMSMSREEFESYRTTQPKVDHKMANPNAVGIMADLQNSKGRGAKLFAKRQARCDKFIVDEKVTSQSAPTTPSEPPPPIAISTTEMMNIQNRLANMIQQPMPIIQAQAQQSQAPPPTAPKPQPAPPQFAPQQPMFAPTPPPAVNKHIGVALPTTNADLKAEFRNAFEGPNFNRVARGWKTGPSEVPCSSDL